MAGSWRLTRPTWTPARRGCSTWWRKRSAPAPRQGAPMHKIVAALGGFPGPFPFRDDQHGLLGGGGLQGKFSPGGGVGQKEPPPGLGPPRLPPPADPADPVLGDF